MTAAHQRPEPGRPGAISEQRFEELTLAFDREEGDLGMNDVQDVRALRYRSVGLTEADFCRYQALMTAREELKVGGHYIEVWKFDMGDYVDYRACDMIVFGRAPDHFAGFNPGRFELSNFYFQNPKRQYGEDYFLIPVEMYYGPDRRVGSLSAED